MSQISDTSMSAPASSDSSAPASSAPASSAPAASDVVKAGPAPYVEPQGLDAGVTDEFLNIKCSDGQVVKIHRRACKLSGMLRGLLQTNPNVPEIEIKQLDKKAIQKVVEYLEHYRDKEPKELKPPLPSAELKDVADAWDVQFVALDTPETVPDLLTLMLSSNFMDIVPLRSLACAKFATFLKSKNCEELKKLLGIENQLTPQQENEIRKKYPEYFAWLKPPTEEKQ